MRKAVPGKASSTRLSVSQKGGGGGGGRKGALVESPENLQQVRCDAGPRRWLSPQLGRLGIKESVKKKTPKAVCLSAPQHRLISSGRSILFCVLFKRKAEPQRGVWSVLLARFLSIS